MENLHKHNVMLSAGQKRKIITAFRKRRPAVVGLKYEQLTGGRDQILLTNAQHKSLLKAAKARHGLRLVLDYEQLVKNRDGGLLKEMLGIIEKLPLVGKTVISPLVKKQLAPLLRNHFIPWLKRLVDSELDTIIETDPQGSGLRRRIVSKLDSLLARNKKGKSSSPCRSAISSASRRN